MNNKIQNIYKYFSDLYKEKYCEISKKISRYNETKIDEYEIEKVDRIVTYDDHADYLIKLRNTEEVEKFMEYDINVLEEEISTPILKIIKQEYYKKKSLFESYRYEVALPKVISDNLSDEQKLVIKSLKKFVNLRCAYISKNIEVKI